MLTQNNFFYFNTTFTFYRILFVKKKLTTLEIGLEKSQLKQASSVMTTTLENN